MTKASPFIQDRAIPLYPGLAMFLDYLPGVDTAKRQRTSKKTGKTSEVTMTTRGMVRALVLTQLDHRLQDNPADRDLLVRDGARWYARSYESWHYWDFRHFMSFPTMKRAFQQLAAAGYILRRSQTDFITPDLALPDRKAILKVMHVYNGLAWGIDYERLEEAMANNAEVQAYYASQREPLRDEKGSDQPDPTRPGSDQPDPTPRISLIRQSGSGRSDPPDQPDPTGGISLIRDQQSLDQTPDQRSAESSAAAEPAPPPDQIPGGSNLTENRQPVTPPVELDEEQRTGYMKLAAYYIDPDDALDIVQRCKLSQIEAWMDYIRRANEPGSKLKPVERPSGYLVAMLKNPKNYPKPAPKPEPPGQRFKSGPFANDIKS